MVVGNAGEKPIRKYAMVPAQVHGVIYPCHLTSGPIKVDGFLNESAWEKAPVVNFTVPKTFAGPISSEARVLYDNKYLYVGFKAYDKDLQAYHRERDSAICNDDVLEIFIKPDTIYIQTDPTPYCDFEINALGTVMDAFVRKRNAATNFAQWSRWNCRGLKVATQIKGTLNDWIGVDEYWTLEVAIPFAEPPSLKGKTPKKGDVWLFNLVRYDYSIYLPDGMELSSYAPLSVVDFHRYEEWAKLKFE